MDSIYEALQIAKESVENCLQDKEIVLTVSRLANLIAETFQNGNKVLICGNGGSNADAISFCRGIYRKIS